MVQFKVRQSGSLFLVEGPKGFRFPCVSRAGAEQLAERATWNVNNGWDWNR